MVPVADDVGPGMAAGQPCGDDRRGGAQDDGAEGQDDSYGDP